MNKTTKTILIVSSLGVVAYLLYKGKIIGKKGGDITPTPNPNCPKCGLIKCQEGKIPQEVGECGCECVSTQVDSHPAPPKGCNYDSDFNLICGDIDVEVFDTPIKPPSDYDFNPLLNLIEKVYVNSSFVYDKGIKEVIFNELKKMSLDELKTTQAFFTASLNDVELPQDIDAAMDLVFSRYPLLGQPIIVQSQIDQEALSVSRKAPEGDRGDEGSGLINTMEAVADVAEVLAGVAALVASAPVAAAVAAVWGIAKGIGRLLRRRRK
jgi:hypothetical protein